ncbi:hypothetical protein [Variovorax sp. LjRoot130]|uniref:hypothetical protein n=1 Tax=Variovorax sp. LjRoot130 TaxID=3342261 RepID=UPI003F51390A
MAGPAPDCLKIDKSTAHRTGNAGAADGRFAIGAPAMAPPRLQPHALCAAFPDMDAADYTFLKEDVAANGVRQAIVLLDGQILDGRHRYRAAMELDMGCPCTIFAGKDPQQFVVSANAARRNLSASQRALAIVSVFEWRPLGSNQHGGWAPGAHPPKSTAELAKLTGLSERTIKQAKQVKAADRPDVADEVRSGTLSLKGATERIKPSQRAHASAPKPAGKQAVGEPSSSPLAPVIAPAQAQAPAPSREGSNAEAAPADEKIAEIDALKKLVQALEVELAQEKTRARDLERKAKLLGTELEQEKKRGRRYAQLYPQLQTLLKVSSSEAMVTAVERLVARTK